MASIQAPGLSACDGGQRPQRIVGRVAASPLHVLQEQADPRQWPAGRADGSPLAPAAPAWPPPSCGGGQRREGSAMSHAACAGAENALPQPRSGSPPLLRVGQMMMSTARL